MHTFAHLPPVLHIAGSIDATHPLQPPPEPPAPIPDPEPASPSLDEPDPGVFHHTPARPPE